MYKVYILLFLLVLNGCTKESVPPSPDYGEEYFQMECIWSDPADGDPRWRCSQYVETDLVSGFFVLQHAVPMDLFFCGENLTLQSGIGAYDNLITYLTEDKFECLHLKEDTKKGNSFDWEWDISVRLLQVIWRPDIGDHKMASLVIEKGGYYEIVTGIVYYKILLND